MKAIKRPVTIEDSKRLILTNLPLRQGQRVKVVLLAEEEPGYDVDKVKKLFRATQMLPQAQRITEDEIAAEIAVYRASHENPR